MFFDRAEYESFHEDYSHCDKESLGLEIHEIDFENPSQVAAAVAVILYILTDCTVEVAVIEEEESIYFSVAQFKISYEAAKNNLESRKGIGYVFDCYVKDRSLKTALAW
ncbi:hypothetical protein [Pseudomonas brenneri]